MDNFIVVLVTAPNETEAARIAQALVGERLAACVNIVGSVRSIYRWQGKVEDDSEALLVIKTRKDMFDTIKERVIELHPYEVPEVISLDIAGGSEKYLSWLAAETA